MSSAVKHGLDSSISFWPIQAARKSFCLTDLSPQGPAVASWRELELRPVPAPCQLCGLFSSTVFMQVSGQKAAAPILALRLAQHPNPLQCRLPLRLLKESGTRNL